MKKISLALIAGLLANPVLGNETPKTPSSSKFSGWNATLGGSYAFHFGEKVIKNLFSDTAFPNSEDFIDKAIKAVTVKADLGFGYTGVTENNFLFGSSIFIGFHRFPESIGEINFGIKLNAGMVVTDDIAIKGIIEINSYPVALSTSHLVFFSNIGIGADYAITDHIILGAGAKYNLFPLPVFAIQRVELFAEISYRF